MTDATRITVSTERPYDVVVGRGLLGELPAMLGANGPASRCHPPGRPAHHGRGRP